MLLILYFAALIIGADVFNVRLGVELLTLVVFLAALLITRAAAQFLRDWWFFLVGLVMWNLSGPIAAQSTFPLHLDFMLHLDQVLFLGRDPVVVVQHSLAHPGHIGPLDILSAVVYNAHLPEPYVFGYFLWRLNRPAYWQFAAAVLLLLVLGFVTFILFPAAPPWMAASRFGQVTSVYNGFGAVLRWHPLPFHGTPLFQVFKFHGDAVAAFPSEHAAFPLLELLIFATVIGRRALPFLIWVGLVCFSVLYLGEHWLTDVLAGWIYAVVIVVAVRWFVNRRGHAGI